MATTYDKASLVMIPSGVKESKLYSIKPTSGDGDFTFSRGTDTATRVNSSGLIEKERSNQLLQSNTFSNASWLTNFVSLSGGQSGYDGSSDAWEMTDTRATGNGTWMYQNISQTGVLNFSFYAKAGTQSFLRCLIIGTGGATLWLDLTAGTISNDTGVISATATSVGGGWYRISFSGNVTASAVRIQMADGAGSSSSTLGATTYIQDAQLEQGLVATAPAIETTTAAVYEGITDNLPRLDYSGGASCPSLLLEPSRSNLIPQSEYYGASNWVKLGAGTGSTPTITHNYATSPEGVQNATRIQLDLNGGTSSGDQSLIYDDLGTKTGDYIRSVYIKSLTSDVDLYFGGTLTDKKIITATTEWQRFEFKSTLSSSGLYATIGLRGTAGSSDSADILIYGFQVESGSYPTSYIPTYGTSASRSEDTCTDGGDADTYNDSEGTLFAEIFIEEDVESNVNISVSNGVHAQDLTKFIYLPSTNEFRFELYGGAAWTTITTNTLSLGVYHKIAGSYDGTNIKLYIDGVEVDTISTNQLPTGLNQFNFDRADGTAPFTGNVKQVLYFPTALTNAELAALTTI